MYKITLGIDGMACEMCEAHVNNAIREAFPVKSVSSDRKKKRTEIVSETELSEAELAAVMEPTGYKMTAYQIKPYEKKPFSLFGRK